MRRLVARGLVLLPGWLRDPSKDLLLSGRCERYLLAFL